MTASNHAAWMWALLLILQFVVTADAQSVGSGGRGREMLGPIGAGSELFQMGINNPCRNDGFRSFNGSCTTVPNKMNGAARTTLFSYFPGHSSTVPTGSDLPSPRRISNVLCEQLSDVFNRRRLSLLVVFFGQFIDHSIVATRATSEHFNIALEPTDKFFTDNRTELPFMRSWRAPAETGDDSERPFNVLSSAIDLASVYGAEESRADELRTFSGGKMKVSDGDLLPFNQPELFNAPVSSPNFFLAGDHRANEHPVLTSLHTLFLREHNLLASEVNVQFPSLSDEDLFQAARKINIAQFQQIVYQEWLPALTGRRLRRYRRFDPNVNPGVSNTFSTAAFRLGHTMVGNVVNRIGASNEPLESLTMQETFFNPGRIISDGIDVFLRGAIGTRAQEVDILIHEALRNFLFDNVNGEDGLDLIALNLQRSRDHAVPSYNRIRQELCGIRRARRFRDITRNVGLQNRLQSVYGTVDNVEAWVGLVSEDHVARSSMGRTMLCVWTREFTRLRDGDMFFYLARGLFPREFERRMGLRRLRRERNLMRRIMLRNTAMTEREIPDSVWRM